MTQRLLEKAEKNLDHIKVSCGFAFMLLFVANTTHPDTVASLVANY
jgi:hypothetical protein